ncbi:MAG: methyltransferase [Candidatus Thermochlorobacter sp.]
MHVPPSKPVISFAEQLLSKVYAPYTFRTLPTEPFASLNYAEELALKNEALAEFWTVHQLDHKPLSILPSPQSRHYRATTKRRVITQRRVTKLSVSSGYAPKSAPETYSSILEPDTHQSLYQFLEAKLNTSAYRQLAEHLNFVIVRSSDEALSVIFNIDLLNAELTRKLKLLSEALQALPQKIVSAFVFQDTSRSRYSFEQKRPETHVPFKRLFGPEKLYLKILGKKYSYHPTAFSQVNVSMLPTMLQIAEKMLAPFASRLLDLYCGYGLFGLFLAEKYDEVLGYDAEGAAIQSAKENALHFKVKKRIGFYACRITGETLRRRLPAANPREHIILDPPRQGTQAGVSHILAMRQPERVLHIFCSVDEIPRELKAWKQHGYNPTHIQPLDMFAGTPNLEVMILLSR